MRRLTRSVAALVACLAATAAPSEDAARPDPDADGLTLSERFEALLARASHEQARLVTLEARFVQHKESALLLEPEESTGTFAFRAPDQVRWDYASPNPVVILARGEEMLTWYRDLDRVERRDLGPQHGRMLSFMGAGSSIATLQRYFTLSATFPQDRTAPYRLQLDPRFARVRKRIRSMTLSLHRELFIPVHLRYVEASGDVTEFHFTDLRINGEIPEDRFELELPDDGED